MNIDWNTNWAPTIVTVVVTVALTFLGIWLQRNWAAKSRPHSENIEATYTEGTIQKFKGVKTYSKRSIEVNPESGRKFSEEVFQFESQEGISTVSAEEIDGMLNESVDDNDNTEKTDL